ncbi:MAG: hypothetical protein JXR07_09935 [Reichenbachiella sp.]
MKDVSMREVHRYLGFFLAGIMMVYALSGILLIYRDTDFLKVEKVVEKQLEANISSDKLGKVLKMRGFKVINEDNNTIDFKSGSYNKVTGLAVINKKELPYLLDKITHFHKAKSSQPLYWLNTFFGVSLLFFVISSFWMFRPKTKVFRQGLYIVLVGAVFALIAIFI